MVKRRGIRLLAVIVAAVMVRGQTEMKWSIGHWMLCIVVAAALGDELEVEQWKAVAVRDCASLKLVS
eukprot:m.76182 g.76182  ORF g.76182 m.76182 type:complete len:67 (+) comp8508_c0_seq2:175-375(+)